MLWILTALSKAKFVWNALLPHWRVLALVGLFLAGLWAGHHLTHQAWEASQQEAINASLAEHFSDEKRANKIGIDLETGLSTYRATVAHPSPHDNSGVFTPERVLSVNQRLAAGRTATQRSN